MDSQPEDNESKQDHENTVRSLSIRRSEFGDYFCAIEARVGEMACPLCKNTVWGVPPRNDNVEYAAIVTIPLPNVAGRGIWAYPAVCVECGFIAAFASNHVSKKIRGE